MKLYKRLLLLFYCDLPRPDGTKRRNQVWLWRQTEGKSSLYLSDVRKVILFSRVHATQHPALSVSRSVGLSVTLYLFYDFYFWTSLLLPKWSSDLKYGPCLPARDWGSRVSGLVFFFPFFPFFLKGIDHEDKPNRPTAACSVLLLRTQLHTLSFFPTFRLSSIPAFLPPSLPSFLSSSLPSILPSFRNSLFYLKIPAEVLNLRMLLTEEWTDGRTDKRKDRPTEGWTDRARCGVACKRLKSSKNSFIDVSAPKRPWPNGIYVITEQSQKNLDFVECKLNFLRQANLHVKMKKKWQQQQQQ